MILKSAIAAANGMNRILVLPKIAPHNFLWYGYEKFQSNETVSMGELLDIELLNSVVNRGVRVYNGTLTELRVRNRNTVEPLVKSLVCVESVATQKVENLHQVSVCSEERQAHERAAILLYVVPPANMETSNALRRCLLQQRQHVALLRPIKPLL